MALLHRAVRWLEPACPAGPQVVRAPRRPQADARPTWIWREFLTGCQSLGPLTSDSPEYQVMLAALSQWRLGLPSSVALLGAFGAGKSALLGRIAATTSDLPTTHHRFTSRILDQEQLLIQVANALELPSPANWDDLAVRLQAGPAKVILLDDCHLLFLRRPGGFAPLDHLLRLIRTTGRHILWITTWNVYSWIYLEFIRHVSNHFAVVHSIAAQSPAEMRRMLLHRLEQLDVQASWPAGEEEEIFHTIWTRSRGRPALAQHVFIRSLRPARDNRFTLHADSIYRLPQECPVEDSEDLYALGSLIRHGVLTAQELATINHISELHAATILARTTANELTISLEPDYRPNPIYTDAIVAYLDSRRAISFREVGAG